MLCRFSLLFTLALCIDPAAAATFLVTTNADSGSGSLRQAILDANATPGPDLIHFSIGTGPQTIAPLSALPIITDTVDIDGSTQPGYSGVPIVQIVGSSAGTASAGLQLECTASAIVGLHIQGFRYGSGIIINRGGQHVLVGNFVGGLNLPSENAHGIVINNSIQNQIGLTGPGGPNIISYNRGYGIQFTGSSSNVVEANYIGADGTGTSLGNRSDGVALLAGSSHNSIGGMAPGVANLISGNAGNGIYLSMSPSNTIEGNYIGCDVTGSISLPNQLCGINMLNSSAITIGGDIAAARNLISGNRVHGIEIAGVGSSNTVVQGNYIGVDSTGSAYLQNGGSGIFLHQSAEVSIGGSESGLGNIISGNRGHGVWMFFVRHSVVQGNLIGLDRTGMAMLANGMDGVLLDTCWENVVGGAEPRERNIVSGNQNAGIQLTGSLTTSNTIEGNFVGTTLSGDAAAPNARGLVLHIAPDNTLQSNVISGNASTGLHILGDSNVVVGNFIGTDFTGSKAVPNGGVGISLFSNGSTIGGTAPEDSNVISGNASHGIELPSPSFVQIPLNNVIQGNRIGLNAAGNSAVGNRGFGISLRARSTTIGGSEAGAVNVISGNARGGVSMGLDAATNVLHGNLIGTDHTGQFAVPNHGPGVLLALGSNFNSIGGTGPGEANIIAFNTGDGVLVESPSGRNPIQANSIHSNRRLGINLKGSGEGDGVVTPNDPGDADRGPNNLQNYPVLTNVVYLASSTIIQGYLRSSTNGSFSIDLYANVATEQSGFGEGQFYVGNVDVDTDENGFTEFAFSAPNTFSNQFFTATALNYATGDTSEFSAAMGGIRITSIQRMSDRYHISFTTRTNHTYLVQYASSLNSPSAWSTVVLPPQPIHGTGGTVTISDPVSAVDRMRIYRIVEQ